MNPMAGSMTAPTRAETRGNGPMETAVDLVSGRPKEVFGL